ncbi:hypothetical protein PZ938_02955 [Luteipulveratus sp. YIM 133132]|uniref:hypothetical protein n=1 Tax=Luteipulveratus flavus TaxID=3031728 RepID=UPI0023B04E2D|nr:hypothetical protein [Luteipulveratus sp. YIM 133132]MDE9364551.1 hypothetical protein [Luteipulveratus sp. YIM 133132]
MARLKGKAEAAKQITAALTELGVVATTRPGTSTGPAYIRARLEGVSLLVQVDWEDATWGPQLRHVASTDLGAEAIAQRILLTLEEHVDQQLVRS